MSSTKKLLSRRIPEFLPFYFNLKSFVNKKKLKTKNHQDKNEEEKSEQYFDSHQSNMKIKNEKSNHEMIDQDQNQDQNTQFTIGENCFHTQMLGEISKINEFYLLLEKKALEFANTLGIELDKIRKKPLKDNNKKENYKKKKYRAILFYKSNKQRSELIEFINVLERIEKYKHLNYKMMNYVIKKQKNRLAKKKEMFSKEDKSKDSMQENDSKNEESPMSPFTYHISTQKEDIDSDNNERDETDGSLQKDVFDAKYGQTNHILEETSHDIEREESISEDNEMSKKETIIDFYEISEKPITDRITEKKKTKITDASEEIKILTDKYKQEKKKEYRQSTETKNHLKIEKQRNTGQEKETNKIEGTSPSYLKSILSQAYFVRSEKIPILLKHIKKHYKTTFNKKIHVKTNFYLVFLSGVLLTLCFVANIRFFWYVFYSQKETLLNETSAKIFIPPMLFSPLVYFSTIFLGIYLFGLVLLILKSKNVNTSFIFKFNFDTRLDVSRYFLMSSAFHFIYLVMCYILVETLDHMKGFFPGNRVFRTIFSQTGKHGILPNCMAILSPIFIIMILFILPLPIYLYSRLYALKLVGNFFFPFYQVKYKDFFFCDWFVSYSFIIHHFITWYEKYFLSNQSKNLSTILFLFFLREFPLMARICQCLRRYQDTFKKIHLLNLLKYALIILSFKIPIILIISIIYSFIWDLLIDCGFGRKKYIYRKILFFFVAYNFLVRGTVGIFKYLSWEMCTESLKNHKFLKAPPEFFIFFLALSEIFRRFLWAVLRTEYEHLSNCDKLKISDTFKIKEREDFVMDETMDEIED